MESSNNIYHDSKRNKSSTEPQRQAVMLRRSRILRCMEFLQKQTEARDDEPKSHHRQPGANPRQQRALGREIIAEAGPLRGGFRIVHLCEILGLGETAEECDCKVSGVVVPDSSLHRVTVPETRPSALL